MSNAGQSRFFLERHYPEVKKALDGGGVEKLFAHFQRVISSEHVMPKLELTHPGEPVYILESDTAPLYEITRQTEKGVQDTITECPVIQGSWRITTKSYFWPVVLALKYMDEKRVQEEKIKMTSLFLAFLIYAGPGLQFKYFRRHYQANAMDYAMNSMSDKFILKQEGTMLKALVAISWRAHQKYAYLLKKGDDASLLRYFVNMWSRLNGMVKGLKKQYESTRASGAYLNQSRDKHEDGEINERNTDGGNVQALTDKFAERFFGETMPPQIVEIASQMTDTPKQSIILAVNEIRGGDSENPRRIFQLITELFFEETSSSQEDIRTRGFLSFANAIYTRSNTVDGRIEQLKKLLDKMLEEHSPQYLRTNREATKGAFRKSLYMVFVLFMQTKA